MAKLFLLKSEHDFEGFRASKPYQSAFLKIRVHESLNQNAPRFGFIIPKKTVPKVVHRNLIKRRIKSLLTKHLPRIKSVDVLFYPRAQVLKIKYSELEKETELIFSKARIWKS